MKTVCITVNDDGTYTVELEPVSQTPEQPEAPEMSQDGMGQELAEGEAGQTVQSVEEAMALVAQMLQDDGRTPEQQMQQGYDRGRPSVGKVFGG